MGSSMRKNNKKVSVQGTVDLWSYIFKVCQPTVRSGVQNPFCHFFMDEPIWSLSPVQCDFVLFRHKPISVTCNMDKTSTNQIYV